MRMFHPWDPHHRPGLTRAWKPQLSVPRAYTKHIQQSFSSLVFSSHFLYSLFFSILSLLLILFRGKFHSYLPSHSRWKPWNYPWLITWVYKVLSHQQVTGLGTGLMTERLVWWCLLTGNNESLVGIFSLIKTWSQKGGGEVLERSFLCYFLKQNEGIKKGV